MRDLFLFPVAANCSIVLSSRSRWFAESPTKTSLSCQRPNRSVPERETLRGKPASEVRTAAILLEDQMRCERFQLGVLDPMEVVGSPGWHGISGVRAFASGVSEMCCLSELVFEGSSDYSLTMILANSRIGCIR